MEHDDQNLFIKARQCSSRDDSDAFNVRRESFTGTALRTIYVGKDFDLSRLSQKFADGVLSISIPRIAGGGQSRKRVAL